MMLARTAWQPVRAEDRAQHRRQLWPIGISCGHRCRPHRYFAGCGQLPWVPEYEFNLKLADVIVQSLHEAGFDKTVRLVTSGTRMASLFERTSTESNTSPRHMRCHQGLRPHQYQSLFPTQVMLMPALPDC
jgi:hypothetical protein